MNEVLESMQREINKLKRQVEAFQSGGYSTVQFVPLTVSLTSDTFDGDAYSTTAKTLIDLSAVFGAPAGLKAVLLKVAIRDSGSSGTDCRIYLSPNDTAGGGPGLTCPAANDFYGRASMVIPCSASGDIYYQIQASDVGTMDVTIEIFGYWI